MSRSSYKIKFIDNSIHRLEKKNNNFTKSIYIYSRRSSIPEFLIGENVFIYSGLTFTKVKLVPEMINLKFGDLVHTKKRGPEIHNKKKKKKK